MKKAIAIILIHTAALTTSGQSIAERMQEFYDPFINVASESFTNPAMYQWYSKVSLSEVGVGYTDNNVDTAIDPQRGEGRRYWAFNADTYMKHGTSTIWGEAHYRNGKDRNVKWNETADIDLLYPYVTADSIGGDLKLENYCFSGGYADHRGRWSWGGEIGYDAGLYYRNIDPRPKNVTGRLDASLGAGYNLTEDYDITVSFGLRRYTQTNDISFKSEMGIEKVYHLTGLGTVYERFTGLGYSSHYDGYSYGATIGVMPRSLSGIALSIGASRFTFDKTLSDLNDLPLASAWHNEIIAQLSYMHRGTAIDYALTTNLVLSRRHGTENIFGDPSSNIYPLIHSMVMYADNRYRASVSGLVTYHTSRHRIWLRGMGGKNHRSESYLMPYIEKKGECNIYDIAAGASCIIGGKWLLSGNAGAERNEYGFDMVKAGASVSREIRSGYAIGMYATCNYNRHYTLMDFGLNIKF